MERWMERMLDGYLICGPEVEEATRIGEMLEAIGCQICGRV